MLTRRSFTKVAASAAGLIALAPKGLAAPEAPNRRKIRYAVAGLGSFASYVAPRIHASRHSAITALVSSDAAKATSWAADYGVPDSCLYDFDAICALADNDQVDAVYIATPVGTHARYAIAALEAGKHVMVEKTMAATTADAQAMIDAARKNNRKLMVAYRARYEPFNKQAMAFAREQTFGRVTSIAAHKGFLIGDRLGKKQWRTKRALAGGGALTDIGIYSIQACRTIAGAEPVEVSAFAHSNPGDERFKEVEQSLSFMLRFKDGLLATGSASWDYALQNDYRVGAERGSYELAPATSNLNLRLFVNTREPRARTERFLRNIDQIDAEFAHFADCIHEGREPDTPGEEGLKDLRVIEALYRSAREGRPVLL